MAKEFAEPRTHAKAFEGLPQDEEERIIMKSLPMTPDQTHAYLQGVADGRSVERRLIANKTKPYPKWVGKKTRQNRKRKALATPPRPGPHA